MGQICVGFGEGLATEKSVVRRQGRGVYAFNHVRFFRVNQRLFTARIAAPKNKDDLFFLFRNQLDYAIRKPRPAALGVGICLMLAN